MQDPRRAVHDEPEHDERGGISTDDTQDDPVRHGCDRAVIGIRGCHRATSAAAPASTPRNAMVACRDEACSVDPQHAEAGIGEGNRQQRADVAEDGIRRIAPGGHAQRGGHVGAATVPRNQCRRGRRGVADGARQHHRREPALRERRS